MDLVVALCRGGSDPGAAAPPAGRRPPMKEETAALPAPCCIDSSCWTLMPPGSAPYVGMESGAA